MIPRLLLLAGLPLVSCASGPIITRPDGTKVVINPSLLEKTTEESAVVAFPDGLQIAYSKKGKDQTMVAKEGIRGHFSVAGVKALWGGQNTSAEIAEKGETARALSADSVKKADISANQAIRTFVPHTP
jgi:hypothetical protein